MLNRTCGLAALVFVMALPLAGRGSDEPFAYTPVARGINPATFDSTYKPCDDFYHFVNARWQASNPVPPEYGSWSLGHEIYENNNKILKQILEDVSAQSPAQGTMDQKIGDFYYSAMDSVAIEAAGISPLHDQLAKIDAIANLKDLAAVIGGNHAGGRNSFFDIDAEQDITNSDQVILYASQGGLGLPDRDYYTRDDEASKKIREQYVAHVARMLTFLGIDEASAKTQADAVMGIETKLAKASLTNVESRDPSTWYNLKTAVEADQLTPEFSWEDYLAAIGIPQVTSFSLTPEKFFVALNDVFMASSLDDLKSYLRWHLIDASASYLNAAIVQADFDFFGTVMGGRKELRPRWKRALGSVSHYIGEGLGQLYVEKMFPPQSKERALAMVNDLKAAFKQRLENLTWMSDETKARAIGKLDSLGEKIGYPDKWRDYSKLEFDRGNYLDNVRRGRAFERRRNLNKIGKPVDTTEWGMNPQTVNAYYNPLKNEIVFPAGILQPPYFDGQADDAVNYGAMGAIIGHEMTHGFDDMGSKFDAKGNMEEWWTPQDRARFDSLTEQIVKQFDAYKVDDSLAVNGKLTLGENIADLGGLNIAYQALQIARKGKKDPMIDGYTQNQRFFLSFAQAWRSNYTPETITLQVNTDPHSPDQFRVLGPLSNMTAFEKAFGCSDNDPMMRPPDKRIVIW